MWRALPLLLSASWVCAINAFLKPAISNGPVAELKIAAVDMSNATSTIRTAAGLAPEGGHDQGAAAILLEMEQYTEDLAEQVHSLWVNATANQRAVQAHRQLSASGEAQAVTHPIVHPVAVLDRGGSVLGVARANFTSGADWLDQRSKRNEWHVQGNLTNGDVQLVNGNFSLEKPGSKKGRSIPGLHAAMGTILEAMQHVQSAARAQQLGSGGEDLVSTVQLVMDRSRELYNMVEVATARVAGGKDAQARVEQKLSKLQSRNPKQSADIGNEPLAMTRELRLVKHVVREAVGGSSRGDVTRFARESIKVNRGIK